jgi:biotin carboxyl carrier protein
VEAMKVMNEITSTVSGRVSKIMTENGKSVEANQVVLVVSPV